MSNTSLPETEESVYDLLAYIRKHRGLDAPELSLSRVEAFLRGYQMALRGRFELREIGHFQKFCSWVVRRLGVPGSDYWLRAILQSTPSDSEAFARFFELLDEFRMENP